MYTEQTAVTIPEANPIMQRKTIREAYEYEALAPVQPMVKTRQQRIMESFLPNVLPMSMAKRHPKIPPMKMLEA